MNETRSTEGGDEVPSASHPPIPFDSATPIETRDERRSASGGDDSSFASHGPADLDPAAPEEVSDESESTGADDVVSDSPHSPEWFEEAVPAVAEDEDELFEHNIRQIDLMYVPAGSMVKGLIMELERGDRDTFIRLRDPDVGGHGVSYDFVKGDPALVGKIGRALGFASVTANRLEVRRG